jgi:putative ABC transport system permease protein
MIRNYFKIALRNIGRHKVFSAINIVGLAIGIAASLLLFLVISYEYSYNKYNRNFARIGRIYTQSKDADGISYNPGVPHPLLPILRTEFPQVKFAPVNSSFGSQITVLTNTGNPDKKFIESQNVFFLDPEFFKVFDNRMLAGNPSSLAEPNSVILSKKLAAKYFNDWQNAVGRTLKMDNALTLKVTGVVDDMPLNSDLRLDVAVSYETLKQNRDLGLFGYTEEWGSLSSNFQVFALFPDKASMSAYSERLKALSNKQYKESRRAGRLHLIQPLEQLHYDTDLESFGDHITSKSTLITLSFIGILIILMACINFVNLSTAQAVGRSKEIGVRKVLGGNKKQLFAQMMGETGFIVLLAIMLAVAIARLAMPYIKDIVSIEEDLTLMSVKILVFVVITGMVVTLLAGLYPSLIVSGFNPSLALKNKISSKSIGGISLRRVLVVLQFGISQVLIIGTIVAVTQMAFVRSADLGLNKDAVLVLSSNADSATRARYAAFKETVLQLPGVSSVSFGSDIPSSDNNWSSNFAFNSGDDLGYGVFLKFGDEDYFKTFGLQMAAGRGFSKSDTSREIVINETLAKKLGFQNPNEIIGKTIRLGGGSFKPIVGVVKDFKTNSLRETVKPLYITSTKDFYGTVAVKLQSANLVKTREAIQAAWDKFYPEYANNIGFMDETIERFYRQETQLAKLYKIFAGLAIFISCLGLYGLVSFLAVQKTKEVGIRKVLGASVANIVYLFSKEFTVLICVAFVVAAPVAYYLMNEWLKNFVDKIGLDAWIFGLAILLSIGVAWITVGYKAVKAALSNPVKSIRAE